MQNAVIHDLKVIGHKLLDEYIAMDDKREPKKAKQHAYGKLASKLNVSEEYAHFAKMTDKRQITYAISRLKKMIRKRQCRLHFEELNRRKSVVAPNVRELQKSIKFTKVKSGPERSTIYKINHEE